MPDVERLRRIATQSCCLIARPLISKIAIQVCFVEGVTPTTDYRSNDMRGQAIKAGTEDIVFSDDLSTKAKSRLTKLAAWINDRNIPFLVTSIGMVVMLLWAGSFKMTRPGAEGIIPLVSNSPLIWWQFKIFGPYIGSDFIGLTEWLAAILIIAGYFRPKAGIVGGLITTVMFFTTSTMILTTPGVIMSVPGIHAMRYLSVLGLFLFKDVISLGMSFYLISYFGKKAILSENKRTKAAEG